ncbi:MAG: hypothetical protein LBL07_09380 [Tannerella sp.]|jgi:hypothetical protein|nr:hypothetical protein [Tannerella sp.]
MNKKISIGALIRKTVKEQQISIKGFAGKSGKDRRTVYDIFSRTSIQECLRDMLQFKMLFTSSQYETVS